MPWRVGFSARRNRAYLYNPDTGESKWPVASGPTTPVRPGCAPCRQAACRRRHNLWKRRLIAPTSPREHGPRPRVQKGSDLQSCTLRPQRLVGYDGAPLPRRGTPAGNLLPRLPPNSWSPTCAARGLSTGRPFDAATCFAAMPLLRLHRRGAPLCPEPAGAPAGRSATRDHHARRERLRDPLRNSGVEGLPRGRGSRRRLPVPLRRPGA